MRAVRFAISIPQFYGDGQFDPGAFRAYLRRVEQLGYESAWTQEAVLGSSPQLAPLEAMTYAAACTQRLRLGCVVFVTTLHNPLHLAKALSSLDQLSGGRVEVGVGTGGKMRPFAAFGISSDRYVARFTEGLAVMKALWTEPSVTFDGEFWQLRDAAMEPKPAQKPYPPIWFGANGEAALRRAALAGAGRDPASFPIAKRIYIAVNDDAARGRERVNATMARIYGRRVPDIEAAAVAGTPDDCVRAARDVAAAGAELILFTTLFDPAEQAERLAAEVMPRVAAEG
jgi:alkanesulfonate monooxygenase SsuD/methylene tetrahydromethanopterin reductase-like flavin-dependent oxidoreductase (luciferase family)